MRPSLRPALFLVPGLVAACLAACAGPWSSDHPPITVVPAQVKEPPGPTDASGMGATPTPSPTAPLPRRTSPPASAPAPAR